MRQCAISQRFYCRDDSFDQHLSPRGSQSTPGHTARGSGPLRWPLGCPSNVGERVWAKGLAQGPVTHTHWRAPVCGDKVADGSLFWGVLLWVMGDEDLTVYLDLGSFFTYDSLKIQIMRLKGELGTPDRLV